MGIGDRFKKAIGDVVKQNQNSQTLKNLQDPGLIGHGKALELVIMELNSAFGRQKWWQPAPGQSEGSHKEETERVLNVIWGERFKPEKLEGPTASCFIFSVLCLVCQLDISVPKEKFFSNLDYAIGESVLEDINFFFEEFIFFDLEPSGYLQYGLEKLLPTYVAKNYPDHSFRSRAELIEKKKKMYESTIGTHVLESESMPLFAILGSLVIGEGSGPQTLLVKALENFDPERLTEDFVANLYYVHSSLKPDPKQKYMHAIFCKDGILMTETENHSRPPSWIPKSEVKSLMFGLAHDALTVNGNARYEYYKLFIYMNFKNRKARILYQTVGKDRQTAFIAVQEFKREQMPEISNYYDVDWTDEVIDESSHYTRSTTTTTTYWSWTS